MISHEGIAKGLKVLNINNRIAWVFFVNNASLFALIALIIFFSLVSPQFFSLSNLFNILDLVSLVGITSLAMSFVLMIGSIDLSVEGLVGLCGIITSFLVKNFVNTNDFGFYALLISMAVGFIFGVANGAILSKFKVPSFMTTLGVGFIATGVGILVTRGNPIVITDWTFRQLGIGRVGVIPYTFLVTLVVIFFMWFIHERTVFGRHMLALGGDEIIAKHLGIDVDRVKIVVFALAGMLYGLVGALLTAKLGSGDINAPIGFTFDSIGACVLGGIAITGGVGSVFKAIIGVFMLTILRNGMIILGISPYVQQGVIGIILIFTVALTIDRRKIKIMK